jgi:glucose/arabinose dehydrogenase
MLQLLSRYPAPLRAAIFLFLLLIAALTAGFSLSSGANGRPSLNPNLTSIPAHLNVSLVSVAAGFNQPTAIRHAGDGRLFVVEQAGVIRIIDENGDVLPDPFLDIQDRGGNWLL